MNRKQELITQVLDIVLGCCNTEIYGVTPMTSDDILGPNRSENVVMTRCLFVTQMIFMGFSRTTVANILHRNEKTIGNILTQAHQYRITSYAYRLAEAAARSRAYTRTSCSLSAATIC